jgi:hypothetical protein
VTNTRQITSCALLNISYGYRQDYNISGPEAPPWVGEVKARASGEGFATIKRWLDDADFLALVEDRAQPLIVLPWARWEELLVALKGRQP